MKQELGRECNIIHSNMDGRIGVRVVSVVNSETGRCKEK
jgi:hypothetical protein